jgi:hypothetical protein
VRALLINIASADHRPQWRPESFFRRYADPGKIGQVKIPEALGIK